MSMPDFERAKQYALDRLKRELDPALSYHSLAHTRDDVLPAAERLAVMEGVDKEALLLLRTAACYHDIGFVEQRHEHESAGVLIARATLPRLGYGPEQIETICGMIMATRLPQSPLTPLEAILVDADLDSLGRDDFLSRSLALRDELAAFGAPVGEEAWYERQMEFLRTHRYFTVAARALRDAQKRRNIATVNALLAACRGHEGGLR